MLGLHPVWGGQAGGRVGVGPAPALPGLQEEQRGGGSDTGDILDKNHN